jgi:hypothetical protein
MSTLHYRGKTRNIDIYACGLSLCMVSLTSTLIRSIFFTFLLPSTNEKHLQILTNEMRKPLHQTKSILLICRMRGDDIDYVTSERLQDADHCLARNVIDLSFSDKRTDGFLQMSDGWL